MKKVLFFLIILILVFNIGCSSSKEEIIPNTEITSKQWNKIIDSANGTIVNVLYYSRDKNIIEWFEKDYTKDLKIKYNIDLRFTYMPLEKIKEALIESKDKNESTQYDLILISEDGFKFFKENELLYKNTLDKLPNYYSNLQGEEYFTVYDEGIEINKLEVPIYRNQLVFAHNEDVIYETPRTFDELLEVAKNNKGKITYIHPSDKTGLAFLLSVVSSKVDFKELNKLKPDKEIVYNKIKPAIEYLVELDKYLYNKGESYPENTEEIDKLFSEDTLLFSLTMDNSHVTEKITETYFKKGCNTFSIDEGTTGFVEYIAMPNNADNKSGAFVTMNNLISGETQAIIYRDKDLNKLPIVNLNTITSSELMYIKNVKTKYTSIDFDDLTDSYIPEIKPEIEKIIYELWSEYVE